MATHIPLTGLPRPGQFPELDAETRVPALIGVSVAFATASTIAVGLRLYTRGFVIRALGIDDATIAFAQVWPCSKSEDAHFLSRRGARAANLDAASS